MTQTVTKTETWYDRDTGEMKKREWVRWQCPKKWLLFLDPHDEIDEWKDRNYLGGTPG